MSYKSLTLLRGYDHDIPDQEDDLIVCALERVPTLNPTKSHLLVVNPFDQEGWFIRSREDIISFKTVLTGAFVTLPENIATLLSLNQTIAWPRMSGVVTSQKFDQDVSHVFFNEPIFIVGLCGWFNREWCATPMGEYIASKGWRHYVAAGGMFAFTLLMHESSKDDEVFPISLMSSEILESSDLHALVDALRYLYPYPPGSEIFVENLTLTDAILLVCWRMAYGDQATIVVFKNKVEPRWKRLCQHLGFSIGKNTMVDYKATHPFSLTKGYWILKFFDSKRIYDQIQRHSKIIPERMFGREIDT